MQLELPRTGLNGSALVELLAQLALTDSPRSPPSFVEGLGRWLGWKEAIHLSAALSAAAPAASPAASQAPARTAPSGQAGASASARLDAEFTRVRTAMALAIAQALDEADTGHDRLDFLPWRRCCFRLQQAMEAAVGPLRGQARAVLQGQAARHPDLATLAALDAALATALAPHEQAQLALMPVLLERHFLRQNQPQDLPQDRADGAFRHDMQRLLQAELELRLQPALGLLEALRATHTGSE